MENGFITFPLKLDANQNIAWSCDMVSQTREPENTYEHPKRMLCYHVWAAGTGI